MSALRASWRRDRWVARRRIALRWLAWFGWRYGLPALGVLAALALAWGVVSGWTASADTVQAVSTSAPRLASEPTSERPGDSDLHLKFDPAWAEKASAATVPTLTPYPVASESETTTPFTPHLKPENWLHSKEP